MGERTSREQTCSRRVVLQSGAVAVGVLWTKPITRRVQLIDAAGTPAPSTDPTEVTVTTADTTPTTPTTHATCPVTMHTEADCTTFFGSYDVRFFFASLTAGQDVALEFTFTSGELVPGTLTVTGTADHHGHVALRPAHSFAGPWSARIALRDASSSGAALVAGTFEIRSRCSRGTFTAD